MRSKLFTLYKRDFFKGMVVAVITAIMTFLVDALQSGAVVDLTLLKRVGIAALIGFLSYLLKNLFTNSQGQILTPDPKPPTA
jgi:hypothetical protein